MANIFWQMLLMMLLGASSVVFLPLLIRTVPINVMASVLMAQTFVYYLALFVQYGFQWSGPAVLARMETPLEKRAYWQGSVRLKLFIAFGAIAILWAMFGNVDFGMILGFSALLLGFALNSNWFLQAQVDFKTAPRWTLLGVAVSVVAMALISWVELSIGAWFVGTVFVLVSPQLFLGLGTWLKVKSAYFPDSAEGAPHRNHATSIMLKSDFQLVLSQFLLLASTTMGTLVVGSFANAEITTAYSAIEKLFNLGVTVLLGLYAVQYPKLARQFVENRAEYARQIWRYVATTWLIELLGLLAIAVSGDWVLSLYLGGSLSELALPTVLPFYGCLMLFICQPVLTGHLVLLERKRTVLGINLIMCLSTLLVGLLVVELNPLYWVYGIAAGQLMILVALLVIEPPSILRAA